MQATFKTIFKYSIFLIIVGIIFCIWRINIPSNIYDNEYLSICIIYFCTIFLYIYSLSRYEYFDLFHPIHILTWLYLCLFIFTPLTFINLNMTLCHGVDVMKGCIKGSIIFLLGYLGYIIGYTYNKTKIIPKQIQPIKLPQCCNSYRFKKICLIIWAIGFCVQIIFLCLSGKSLIYILTLSGSGEASKVINSNIGALNNFSFLMVYPWLLICLIKFKIKLKLIISYLTFASFFIIGARFIFIIMCLSFLICMKKIKRIEFTIFRLSIILFCLLCFSAYLGDARRSIDHGSQKEIYLDANRLAYVLQSNFDIYQIHYSVVEHYPEKYDFDYGGHMFGDTFTFWIPRFLWPEKPKVGEQVAGKMIRNTVGEAGVKAAMAWPNLTEYYCDFGPIGVFIIMLLLGIVSKKALNYYYGKNFFNLILYAIFIPLIFQIITRGYTPQNTGLIIFIILPHFIISRIYKAKIKK